MTQNPNSSPMNSDSFDDMDMIFLHDGRLMHTHAEGMCSGEFCCIHNPSDHAMKNFPLNWRADRNLMERVCPHGIGHPDPDDLAHKKRSLPDYANYAFGVHGCCGVCH